jgi:hypothetical protein
MNDIFQFTNQEMEAAFIQRKVSIQLKDFFLSKLKFPNKLIEVKQETIIIYSDLIVFFSVSF